MWAEIACRTTRKQLYYISLLVGNWDGESSSSLNHTFSGAIRSLPKIEAFGGAGTRLGGGDEETMHVQPYNILQDPLVRDWIYNLQPLLCTNNI